MALRFPSDENAYLGRISFVAIDDSNSEQAPQAGGSCELYLPIGVQISDKMEYENVGLGSSGEFIANGATTVPMSEGALGDIAKIGVAGLVAKMSDRAGAALRSRNKSAPNPNTRALFKQVNLRSFQFTFKLIPENEKDASEIPKIIKFFREEMYPEDIAIGGLIAGYKFPKKFAISMEHKGTTFPKIADCFLESFMTNYNPTNGAFLSTDGSTGKPAEVDISMTFTEARTLSKKDIKEGF